MAALSQLFIDSSADFIVSSIPAVVAVFRLGGRVTGVGKSSKTSCKYLTHEFLPFSARFIESLRACRAYRSGVRPIRYFRKPSARVIRQNLTGTSDVSVNSGASMLRWFSPKSRQKNAT